MRVPLPQLTGERRAELSKAAHRYAEGAKVAVRGVRRDGMEQIKALEKKSTICQDDAKRWHDEVQKLTDPTSSGSTTRWRRKTRKSSRSDGGGKAARRRGRRRSRRRRGTRARVPAHVAIIMDGNGRWAAARGLPRVAGHRAGAQAVRRTIEAAIRNGVSWLTLYAFSSENWRRPLSEVLDLTGLLRHYLRNEIAELARQGRAAALHRRPRALRPRHPGRSARAPRATPRPTPAST